MASQVARTARLARLRPSLTKTLSPVAVPAVQSRYASNVPQEEPKKKAQSIVDALPGNSLVSKTAILSSGAALSIFGISNEFIVINEEAVVAFCLLTVFYSVLKYGGPMYNEYAKTQIKKMSDILYAARREHESQVQERIDDVNKLGSVVEVTKNLFAVSKETAELEAKVFELEQKTAIAAEAKAVLDSWVRYEGQVKNRQQKELSDSIIQKISKELDNPKVLQQILQQSVADVERIVASKAQ